MPRKLHSRSISDNAITADHIATGAVTAADIADASITAAKLADTYLTSTGDGSQLTGINTDLVSDTTPQLGGDLASNGNDINFGDNDKAQFGAGNDLQIYHDGGNSLIQDAGTGDLILKSNGTATVIKTNAGNNLISARDAGSVGVFYDGSEKLTTTSTGVSVTGNVTVSGTVDGRDIATDGTKLDGIESGATSDQIIKSTTAPSSPSNGDFWYDSDDYAFYYHDGSTWQLIKNAFSASGGTVTDGGGFRYHTFTSSGTFQVTKGTADVEYLIIAGGGGGATSYGGGGGAGGYISGSTSVSANSYSIVVGGGGPAASRASGSQYNGGNSSAFSLTAIGGGAGGGDDYNGIAGGSGGGASDNNRSGGAGTSGQGYRGGNTTDDNSGGAGGGGAGGQGADVTSGNYSSASSHYGGAGKTWEDGVTRASGGCGAFKQNSTNIGPITGGGGRGGSATSGTANTGGGGGGAYSTNSGGNGGSGIVIIRYPI